MIVINKKGNNTVLYTRPSSDCPKGRMSETLLELICLKYLDNKTLELVLSRDSRSKYRLIKTYTSEDQSLEPFIAPRTTQFISRPKLVYNDDNKTKKILEIDYNIASFLLEDFHQQRVSSRRSRVDKDELQKMGILTQEGQLTDLAELLLYSFESWIIREISIAKDFEDIPESYKIPISTLIDVYLEKKSPISKKFIQEFLKTNNVDLILENLLEKLGYFRWRWLNNQLDIFESDSPWISIKSKLDLWHHIKPGYVIDNPLDILEWDELNYYIQTPTNKIDVQLIIDKNDKIYLIGPGFLYHKRSQC